MFVLNSDATIQLTKKYYTDVRYNSYFGRVLSSVYYCDEFSNTSVDIGHSLIFYRPFFIAAFRQHLVCGPVIQSPCEANLCTSLFLCFRWKMVKFHLEAVLDCFSTSTLTLFSWIHFDNCDALIVPEDVLLNIVWPLSVSQIDFDLFRNEMLTVKCMESWWLSHRSIRVHQSTRENVSKPPPSALYI